MYKTPTLLVFFLCSISFCNAQDAELNRVIIKPKALPLG